MNTMKSYITKTIAAAGICAMTLLGGCGPDYGYRLYENVSEADGFDVEMYNYHDHSVMKVGEFDKNRGRFSDSGLVIAVDDGECCFQEIQLSGVGSNSRLEKLAAPAKLREICKDAKASGRGIGVDFRR